MPSTLESLSPPTPRSRDGRAGLLLAAFGAIGIACRVTQYLWRRSYWHDESYLVLNIVGGHLRDAFGPLKLLQAAPPLFLIVEILATRVFGTTEYALRLVPLVSACASVVMIAILARRVGGPFVACLTTLMFATSNELIWHASECKQYSGDVFVALLLLLLATARDDGPRFVFIAVLASALVWFSHTTMFVFGGVSIVAVTRSSFVRTRRGLLAYVAANALFAASLVALYLVSIRPQQYPEMYAYWQNDFVPWSRPLGLPLWMIRKWLSLANYAYENAAPIVLFAAIGGAACWWREGNRRITLLFALPLALNLLASALHRFPFSGTRVVLYATPIMLILSAVGVERAGVWLASKGRRRAARVLPAALAIIGIGPAAYHLAVPRYRGHVRPAAAFMAARGIGDEPVYVIGRVEPWMCYLPDPSIRWRALESQHSPRIDDAQFWTVFASANADDARRSEAAVGRVTSAATITCRFDVAGGTAIHFARTSRRDQPTTSTAGGASTAASPLEK